MPGNEGDGFSSGYLWRFIEKACKNCDFCLAIFLCAFMEKWPRTLPARMSVGCAEEVVSTVATCQCI